MWLSGEAFQSTVGCALIFIFFDFMNYLIFLLIIE